MCALMLINGYQNDWKQQFSQKEKKKNVKFIDYSNRLRFIKFNRNFFFHHFFMSVSYSSEILTSAYTTVKYTD